jgi:hypothetical protein
VLLFDHSHEVRNVLGNPAESDIDGPITSLDISPTYVPPVMLILHVL